MKYEKEYEEVFGDKNNFIKLLLKRYKYIKKVTAIRRWYDVKKIKVNKTTIPKNLEEENIFEESETNKPSRLKILMLDDMKKYNQKIDSNFLKKYGFTYEEINWLKENKYI